MQISNRLVNNKGLNLREICFKVCEFMTHIGLVHMYYIGFTVDMCSDGL